MIDDDEPDELTTLRVLSAIHGTDLLDLLDVADLPDPADAHRSRPAAQLTVARRPSGYSKEVTRRQRC